jgi:hypothetical protein
LPLFCPLFLTLKNAGRINLQKTGQNVFYSPAIALFRLQLLFANLPSPILVILSMNIAS